MHRATRAKAAPSTAVLFAVALLGASVLPAQGQMQARAEAGLADAVSRVASLQLELTQSSALPLSESLVGPGQRPVFDTSTQTMAWAGKGRVAVGFGVEQRWRAPSWALAPEPQNPRQGSLLLGVSLNTGAGTRWSWQTPPAWLNSATSQSIDDVQRTALDLRRSDPYRSLLRGSLRMELARDTALAFKVRGRHVGLALTSQW